MTVTIIDYGMANLRSVQKAFEAVGHHAKITTSHREIESADRLVLPGVGAFRDAIAKLRETHFDDSIRTFLGTGRPFLGICLGLQMLFSKSYEDGEYEGMNRFEGKIVRFKNQPGLKVPQMGWNAIHHRNGKLESCPLFRDLPAEPSVYFVHSYYAVPDDPSIISAEADYPTPFCAAIARDNIVATQFHPGEESNCRIEDFKKLCELEAIK